MFTRLGVIEEEKCSRSLVKRRNRDRRNYLRISRAALYFYERIRVSRGEQRFHSTCSRIGSDVLSGDIASTLDSFPPFIRLSSFLADKFDNRESKDADAARPASIQSAHSYERKVQRQRKSGLTRETEITIPWIEWMCFLRVFSVSPAPRVGG